MKRTAFLIFVIFIAIQKIEAIEIITTTENDEIIALEVNTSNESYLKINCIDGRQLDLAIENVESIKTGKYVEIITESDNIYQGEIYSYTDKTIQIGLKGYGETTIYRDKIFESSWLSEEHPRFVDFKDNMYQDDLMSKSSPVDIVSPIVNYKQKYPAFGFTFGIPGGINFVAAGYLNDFMIKFDFGISSVLMGSSIGGGYIIFNEPKYSLSAISRFSLLLLHDETITQMGIGFELNFYNIYIEAGPALSRQLSYSSDNLNRNIDASFMIQIGYVYRFNKIK